MKFIYQLSILCLLLVSSGLKAQNNSPTQIIRGVVVDKSSGAPLSYVPVGLLDLPQIGTSTDDNGKFTLTNVPVGRLFIQFPPFTTDQNLPLVAKIFSLVSYFQSALGMAVCIRH